MPLSKGSKAPEKFRSQFVDEITARVAVATDVLELVVLRNVIAHRMAAIEHFEDETRRQRSTRRMRCLIALDDADLRCRCKSGHSLKTIADYDEHKKPGDPSASWIARTIGGGSWPASLAEAGISAEARLEAILVRTAGTRRTTGSGEQWSLDDRVFALARAVEKNHGRQVTKEGYEDFCEIDPLPAPSFKVLVGTGKRGDGTQKAEYTLAQMHELAYRLCETDPVLFPETCDYLARVRTAAAA